MLFCAARLYSSSVMQAGSTAIDIAQVLIAEAKHLGVIKASPAQRRLMELPGCLVEASAHYCLIAPHNDQD